MNPVTKGEAMQVNSYLIFNGRCEEALEFYKRALGAEVTTLIRYGQAPEEVKAQMVVPGTEQKVMHSRFTIGGTELMASDGRCEENSTFSDFSLSLSVQTEEEAQRLFAALAEGGAIQMPLTKTFFSPLFGMVSDRFGLGWMIVMPQQGA
jgi:PhnB protein